MRKRGYERQLYIGNSNYIRLMPNKDVAVIQLRKATRKRLQDVGKKGETYDSIVNRLLDSGSCAPR
jgi:hypothetical protein